MRRDETRRETREMRDERPQEKGGETIILRSVRLYLFRFDTSDILNRDSKTIEVVELPGSDGW